MAADNNADKPKGSYGADSIKQLEGLEAVRKRPGMYIGTTGPRGLHHMIWEVVDNSVDEAMAGHATRVDVKLRADGGVEVIDDGRGIPVAMHAKGIPTVQLVLTSLHAGGKFDSDAYAVSGGLHGVGISVVNALSTRVEAEIKRDGKHWYQNFQNAIPDDLVEGGNARGTGTKIRFWADPEVFETTEYDYDTISRRLQEMAFLNKGLSIELIDERVTEEQIELEEIADAESGETSADETSFDDAPDAGDTFNEESGEAKDAAADKKRRKKITFHYPDGLTDYVKYLNKSKTAIHPTIVSFDAKGEDHEVEVALQWNQGYKQSVHTFANTINTHEGGTHEEGFRAALTSLMNRYAKEHKLLKEKDGNLSGDDCREGLAAVISVKVGDPQFEGQTKTKLGNSEIKGFVQRAVNEHVNDWFDANPAEAKAIINKAVSSAHARMAARKAREMVRRGTPYHGLLYVGAAWGAEFDEFPESGWDKVMNLNVKAPFFLTKALAPTLRASASAKRPAKVINIASIDSGVISAMPEGCFSVRDLADWGASPCQRTTGISMRSQSSSRRLNWSLISALSGPT